MTESVALRSHSDWPTLLVGPIVRKVTRTEAYVFVAARQACTARLIVGRGALLYHELTTDPDPGIPLWPIGTHLYVGLLRAELPEPGPNRLYSYDVELTPDGASQPLRLNELGMLGNPGERPWDRDPLQLHVPLGYATGHLPTFLTPPDNVTELRLAHASCRKPHGNEDDALEPDALPILDEIIARAQFVRVEEDADVAHAWFDAKGNVTIGAPNYPPNDLTDRPHQLIMTGDQIYADDVAPALLDVIRHAAEQLMGWEEYTPGIIHGLNGFMLEPGWRTRYLAMAGVKELPSPDASHDYPQSHLLRFGEWCAMYLLAWSPALWPRTSDGTKVRLRRSDALLPIGAMIGALEFYMDLPSSRFSPQGPVATILDEVLEVGKASHEFETKRKETWDAYREPAMQYGSTVPYVRRVLANTPTYMMFDDHEITDDWFVNRDVATRLLGLDPAAGDLWGREVGPRIMRNGLSAYAVFQHWGNVPDDFAGWETGPGGSGTSVGRQLLSLWAPPQPYQRPTLGGADRSTLRAALEHLVTAVDADGPVPYWIDQDPPAEDAEPPPDPPPAPSEVAATWLNEDDTVDADAHLADELLRITTLPTDDEGGFPGVGDPSDRAGFGRFRWDYAIEFDSHRLIALDTRTWRRFPDALAPLPLLGSLTADDHVAARDVTAPTLGTFASAMTGTDEYGTTLLGQLLADVVTLLVTDLPTATPSLEALADSLDAFLTFAAADPLALQEIQRAIADLRAECDGSALHTVRFVLDSQRGHWARAAAIVRETMELFDLWEPGEASAAVMTVLSSLATYLENVVAGTSRGALEALRHLVGDVRDVVHGVPLLFDSVVSEPVNLDVPYGVAVADLTARIAGHELHERSMIFFRDGTGYLAPELIAAPALEWMVSGPIANVGYGKETVILSPAPVFADDLVDLVQRGLLLKATKDQLAGGEEWDVEAWTSNPVGFDNLVVAAKALRRAVVLSGDVHYAYSTHNHVVLPIDGVDTVYIQLVSSSAKNSDSKTKSIALGGDVLFGGDGRFKLHRFNPIALARGWDHFEPPPGTALPTDPGTDGPISAPQRFVGWAAESLRGTVDTLKQDYHLDDAQLMIDEFLAIENVSDVIEWKVKWHYEPMYRAVTGIDPVNVAAEIWHYVSTAPVTSFTGWFHESLWASIDNVQWIAQVLDDPAKAVFGHYLYSRDVLLEQIADLYKALGVDPAYGVTIDKTNLRDTRPDRLVHYGARNRFAWTEPFTMMYANEQEIQVVGNANVGLVRFTGDHAHRGVRHDLCFYPDPSHPGIVAPPPGPPYRPLPDPPDAGEVAAYPYPRTDWMATRHEARFRWEAP